MLSKKKVLLGMSGGTDSSVAAMLLQEQGFEVIGVTLRLWSDTDKTNEFGTPQYLLDAKELAKKLNIQHEIIDAKDYFYNEIIEYFKSEYVKGRTPNPCAKCNVVLKWKLLLEQANSLNCYYVATGHYSKIVVQDNLYYIHKGVDPDKEQSFFLWGLGQEVLSRAIFPLGEFTKSEVKQIASNRGFEPLANKKESIGVCFIQDGKYQPFLAQLLSGHDEAIKEGSFVNCDGEVLGKHKGYIYYTVGQRRGLGFEPTEPYYVTKIDAFTNTITLGKRKDLYQNEMLVKNYQLVNPKDLEQEVITRIRYRKQAALSCVEILDENTLLVKFNEPEWSIAPGQTAAFYIGDRLLGGGFIEK